MFASAENNFSVVICFFLQNVALKGERIKHQFVCKYFASDYCAIIKLRLFTLAIAQRDI